MASPVPRPTSDGEGLFLAVRVGRRYRVPLALGEVRRPVVWDGLIWSIVLVFKTGVICKLSLILRDAIRSVPWVNDWSCLFVLQGRDRITS